MRVLAQCATRVGNRGRRFATSGVQQRSWVEYDENCIFPVQNIPFGVFSCAANGPRCATAIGNNVVDLAALASAGLLADLPFNASGAFRQPTLNAFMALDRKAWVATRTRLQQLFASDGDDCLRRNDALRKAVLRPLDEVRMHLPAQIGDYTDFYASREHATNVGIMFRGRDNALQPNWLHLPVGYHGRASTVVVSGTPVVRPCGQVQKDKADASQGSVFSDCKLLDYELEMGVFVGGSTPPMGCPIKVEKAEQYIFGYVILNDWSARDIQPWEYVPLGPFTAKNFATTISPWIITPEALEPFVCPTSAGEQSNPIPLEYLRDPNYTSYDLNLAVDMHSPAANGGTTVTTIAETNFKHMYWTARQMLAHHSITGCKMAPGDLFGSGTISGTIDNSSGKSINYGSLLEQCWKGANEIPLKDGEVRKFIRDGDNVVMRGHCQGDGFRIGFGDCAGVVMPAGSMDDAKAVEDAGMKAVMKDVALHGYWRSSCSWRVRIALAFHGVHYENKPVHLVEGKQNEPDYLDRNGLGQVPSFTFTDANSTQHTVTQSLAIIDLLDSVFGGVENGYLVPPADGTVEGALLRSRALQIAEVVNAGTQPLQNLSVLKSVKSALVNGQEVDGKGFATAALARGMAVAEKLVAKADGHFAAGNVLTLADVCLIPQLFNARRFGIDMSQFPNLLRVEAACAELPCFKAAHPDVQPDAQPA